MSHPTPSNLTIRQLGAVLAVARNRSFVAAAAELGISQPTLTRLVQKAERSLGLELFLRTTRQVEMTAAGDAFAATAKRLVEDFDLGVANALERAAGTRAQVVISSVAPLGSAIAGGRRDRSAAVVHLREGLHEVVRGDVESGLADFGVCYAEGLPGRRLDIQRLAQEPLFVIGRRNDGVTQGEGVPLSVLFDVPMVGFPPESRTRRLVDSAAASRKRPLNYVATANRLATLLSLVRLGYGWAVTPRSERPALDDPELVAAPLVRPRLASQLAVVWLKERPLSPASAELAGRVSAWFIGESARDQETAERGKAHGDPDAAPGSRSG
jgi:DNA-binding transcriptional LysR family regulator